MFLPARVLRTLVLAVAVAGGSSSQACLPRTEQAITKAYEAKRWHELITLTAADLEYLPAARFEPVRQQCRWSFRMHYIGLEILSMTFESYDARRREVVAVRGWYGERSIQYLDAVNNFIGWVRPVYEIVASRRPDYMGMAVQQVEDAWRALPDSRQVQAAEEVSAKLGDIEEHDLYVMLVVTLNHQSKNADALRFQFQYMKSMERRGIGKSVQYIEALDSAASLIQATEKAAEALDFSSRALVSA